MRAFGFTDLREQYNLPASYFHNSAFIDQRISSIARHWSVSGCPTEGRLGNHRHSYQQSARAVETTSIL
jgi:hypothetical protein